MSPPHLEVLSELRVTEGGMTVISGDILRVTDTDTREKFLSLQLKSGTSLGKKVYFLRIALKSTHRLLF